MHLKLKFILTQNAKIQQTKMLVTRKRCQDSSVQTKYKKGRFKVMATYLLAAVMQL